MNFDHLEHLRPIAINDAEVVEKADKTYGGSWKRRGGIGAFMMAARKWDRLENAVRNFGYDIFAVIESDNRPEGVIDDIRDLRRYLLLIESEMAARGFAQDEVPKGSLEDLASGLQDKLSDDDDDLIEEPRAQDLHP